MVHSMRNILYHLISLACIKCHLQDKKLFTTLQNVATESKHNDWHTHNTFHCNVIIFFFFLVKSVAMSDPRCIQVVPIICTGFNIKLNGFRTISSASGFFRHRTTLMCHVEAECDTI